MGEFLAMSGIVGATGDQAREVIREYVGRMKRQLPKRDRGQILASRANVTVLYPASFVEWDELSRLLSERLRRSVFSFHIHDGDLWMFILFRDGKQVSQFNTVPRYWEELDETEATKWAGDTSAVAEAAGVQPDSVRPYLQVWSETDLQEGSARARPDDQFTRGNAWQLIDFMKAIGFEYPIDDNGAAKGESFHMSR